MREPVGWPSDYLALFFEAGLVTFGHLFLFAVWAQVICKLTVGAIFRTVSRAHVTSHFLPRSLDMCIYVSYALTYRLDPHGSANPQELRALPRKPALTIDSDH